MSDKSTHFIDRTAWRSWLVTHHASEKVLWMRFYKKHTAKQGVSYNEAVEEAICFGWIDSIIKRIDDDCYMQKFTPRTDTVNWSETNIARLKKCVAEGRMTDAGYAKIADLDGLLAFEPQPKSVFTVPSYISNEMEKNPMAKSAFHLLTPSKKKNYCGWIDSAVKMETKMKRIAEVIDLLETGKELGMK